MKPFYKIVSVFLAALFALACCASFAAAYDENYKHMTPRAYLKALHRSRNHMYDSRKKYDEPYTFGMLVHELIARGLDCA